MNIRCQHKLITISTTCSETTEIVTGSNFEQHNAIFATLTDKQNPVVRSMPSNTIIPQCHWSRIMLFTCVKLLPSCFLSDCHLQLPQYLWGILNVWAPLPSEIHHSEPYDAPWNFVLIYLFQNLIGIYMHFRCYDDIVYENHFTFLHFTFRPLLSTQNT